MLSSEEDDLDLTATPRSRREQLIEVVDNYKEKLRQIKGQVFHMMDGHNQLFRLRVGTDGRISLSRHLAIPSTINLADIASVPKRVLEAGMEAGDKMQGRVTRRWRKAVTGDPDKRIRDHMREVPQVKMIDKLSFTFGVLCICGSEWLALRHADWFPLYYFTIMSALLLWRLVTYTKDKYQLFMLDFCYFVNLSVVLQTFFFMSDINWFKANYILCMGPLMFAIIVWKNSLVFHSLDKLTSFFLHAFPPITIHLLRWGLIPSPYYYPSTSLTMAEVLTLPLGLYIIWQLGYWSVTEIILRKKLSEDKDLVTSLRWLVMDKKNGFRNLSLSLLVKLGVSQPGEELVADTLKAKVVFAVLQLLYTVITVLPTYFLYSSYRLSCAYLVLIFGWGTWNGASYYIEVFAERYRLKFVTESEVGETEDARTDLDSEEEEEEEYENAQEDVEIDQSSELYQTIVAAIMEDTEGGRKSRLEGIERNKAAQGDTETESKEWEDLESDLSNMT